VQDTNKRLGGGLVE